MSGQRIPTSSLARRRQQGAPTVGTQSMPTTPFTSISNPCSPSSSMGPPPLPIFAHHPHSEVRMLESEVEDLMQDDTSTNEDDTLGKIAQAMELLSLTPHPAPATEHPTAESILREALRYTLESYKLLKLDKRNMSVVEGSVVYERAIDGVRSAKSHLQWAEHWIQEEKEKRREEILKG